MDALYHFIRFDECYLEEDEKSERSSATLDAHINIRYFYNLGWISFWKLVKMDFSTASGHTF